MQVNNPKMYREHASKIGPTAIPYGGKILAANDAEAKEGAPPYARTVIAEFPSLESVRSWHESAAYQAILPLRLKSTTGTLVMVEGFSLPPATGD